MDVFSAKLYILIFSFHSFEYCILLVFVEHFMDLLYFHSKYVFLVCYIAASHLRGRAGAMQTFFLLCKLVVDMDMPWSSQFY